MARTHPDEKILSYNDVVLRRSDLDILNGPYLLNDRIVEFYFSYLSSTCCSSEVLLVPPSISFWIANCPILEDVKDVVAPLRLQDRKLIIFPVNNNEDVSVAEGGSHWSLLSYYKTCNLFEHYDSFGSLNKRHAMKLCKGIKGLVGAPETMSNFRECNTPQQMNGYDCGLYMLAIAELLCSCHLQEPNDSGQYRFEALQLLEVGQMRRLILKIIEDLRDQVEKESA
ncbi:NEDD8-specific protease 1 [Nymphaea thermarum]|nr:NEDD8-specific protease 1 [Nymphaea thermarum]